MLVSKGKRIKPLAIMAYSEHGLGKTNLPMEAPNPIFIGNEENDDFDISRLPKIEKWSDLTDQLTWLMKTDHGFKTLVIDTVDGLEDICQKEVLKSAQGKTMATAFGGYGKAYEKLSDMFLDIRDDFLVPLRDVKGMNIVLLCHAEKSKHEDPMTNTSYDHYSTALHKSIKPVFEDWVSAILFIQWQLLKAQSNDGREHAVGDGSRMIYTEQRPSHVAKNRFDLPYEISYEKSGTWKEITSHIGSHFKGASKFVASDNIEIKKEVVAESGSSISSEPIDEKSPPSEYVEICKAIDEIFSKVPEAAKEKISLSIQRAGTDVKELNRIYNKIQKVIK